MRDDRRCDDGGQWLHDRRHDIGDGRDDRSQPVAGRTRTKQVAESGRVVGGLGGATTLPEHGEEREQHDAREGDADDAQQQLGRGHRLLRVLRHVLSLGASIRAGSTEGVTTYRERRIIATAIREPPSNDYHVIIASARSFRGFCLKFALPFGVHGRSASGTREPRPTLCRGT